SFKSVLKAAVFGVPLPLCSCGVIPTSVYMARNGASKSAVVSFLISTPQTGIDSIAATYGMMGPVFAIFRPFVALVMGVVGGLGVKLIFKSAEDRKFENIEELEAESSCSDGCGCDDDDSCNDDSCCDDNSSVPEKLSFKEKLRKSMKYSFVEFLDDITMQFLVGLGISGIIAYFIPDNFFSDSSFSDGLPGMLIMILVGVPMYVCATGSIPIAVTLILKGFSPGTAFVFLAVGPATNAASFSIIMKAIGKKTAIYYVLVISLLAIVFGIILDYIFEFMEIEPAAFIKNMRHDDPLISPEVKYLLGAIFLVLIIMSLYRKYFKKKKITNMKAEDTNMEQNNNAIKYIVSGMTCMHCVANVKSAVSELEGVSGVDIELTAGTAIVSGKFDQKIVLSAIEKAGYTAEISG
ncbi:MAG: SO_0444 family Cu/Zn efflux transporter, partial [Chlorobi bacterium]|nr:SO_0444 family Cu/Zn efflux transporter [Chlorobiota bacterium]